MERWVYKLTEPALDNETSLFHETLFHNGNGYLGVRYSLEEGYPSDYTTIRGTYLNGFYDLVTVNHGEKLYGFIDEKQTMINIADTQGVDIYLEEEKFSLYSGTVLKNERFLDLRKGITGRSIIWRSPKGKEIQVEIKRLVSHALLNLFILEYQVESLNFDGSIKFNSYHQGLVKNYANPDDPRVSAEETNYLLPVAAKLVDDISLLQTQTTKSNLILASAVKNVFTSHPRYVWQTSLTNHAAISTCKIPIKQGERVVLTKFATFADSIREENCLTAVLEYLQLASEKSSEYWFERQEEILSDFWQRTSLELEGVPELELALRYNIYQLFQSAGRDQYSNIAAKGLSGEGYEGHYFWDSEIYIQPFFVLNFPEIAKNMLSYRYGILDKAKEHAKIMGHSQGALYAWRTISGEECSGYYPSGSAQYHINGAVAWAVLLYYFATDDFDFMVTKGAEILIETARLWLDVGHWQDGKFHIHAVTGPDEYSCLVNDNFYTNLIAQNNLVWAAKIYRGMEKLGKANPLTEKLGLVAVEIDEFIKAAREMYFPFDEKLGIHAQDGAFLQKPRWDFANTPEENYPLLLNYHPLYLYRHQICKQPDTVLSYFLFGHLLDDEIMRRSYEYYEKITTHDSSLSACIFSIVAAQLGFEEKAAYYFGDSAKLDLFNTHHNTQDGLHTANLGGSYMAIVYGFGGVRLCEDRISFAPILPQNWQSYSFQITYRGRLIRLRVEDKVCHISLIKGKPVEVYVYNKPFHLGAESIALPRI